MNENQLFFFGENLEIYWHGITMALSVLLGYLLFYVFARIINKNAAVPLKFIVLISFPLALLLSRIQYIVFRTPEFSSFVEMLRLTDGGMGLYGAFLGVILAIILVWTRNKSMKLSEMFDAAAVAGCFAIGLGRMAAHFSGEELGFSVTKELAQKLMFTTYSESENALLVTVHIYEAITAAVIFIFLIIDFIQTYATKKFRTGTTAWRFLLLYSATQVMFESWRSDSLFLNSLGFVRYSQAVSAIIFAVVLIVMCIRYSKKYGFNPKQILIWVGLIALIALAFVCEFTMMGSLTGNARLRNYSGMGVGLAGVIAIGCWLINKAQLTADVKKSADSPEETDTKAEDEVTAEVK